MHLSLQTCQPSARKTFVVQYRVRGRKQPHTFTSHCETVQQIIDVGQRSFRAFAERNPWICFDSAQSVVFVGIDPEPPRTSRNSLSGPGFQAPFVVEDHDLAKSG
jgi:hypothetical protein